jgi:hypothetical protein
MMLSWFSLFSCFFDAAAAHAAAHAMVVLMLVHAGIYHDDSLFGLLFPATAARNEEVSCSLAMVA